MPEVTPADAVRTLTEKVRAMDLDDLRDVHNELFPETPIPRINPSSQGAGVRQKVLAYLAAESQSRKSSTSGASFSRKPGTSISTTRRERSNTSSSRKRFNRPTDPHLVRSTVGITDKPMGS